MSGTTTQTGISHVGFVSVNVTDVDAAIDFYTHKLGFDKTTDAAFGPSRWVEMTPPGAQTRVTLIAPGNPAHQPERIGEMATQFEVNGFEATCEELKRRGVTFHKEPKKEFWGWWAEIKDQDGNILGLHAEA